MAKTKQRAVGRDKSIDLGFLEDDRSNGNHHFGYPYSVEVEYIDGWSAGVEPTVSKHLHLQGGVFVIEESDPPEPAPEIGDRNIIVPPDHPSWPVGMADDDPLQDPINKAVLAYLTEKVGTATNGALCDGLYRRIHFELGMRTDRGGVIGFSALMERVGAQERKFLDGQAMIEKAALFVMDGKQRMRFAAYPTYHGRLAFARKVLRWDGLVTEEEYGGKRRQILKPNFPDLVAR